MKKSISTRNAKTVGFTTAKNTTKRSNSDSNGGVVYRNAKSGRFVDGVKMTARRDRAGLIKLADR